MAVRRVLTAVALLSRALADGTPPLPDQGSLGQPSNRSDAASAAPPLPGQAPLGPSSNFSGASGSPAPPPAPEPLEPPSNRSEAGAFAPSTANVSNGTSAAFLARAGAGDAAHSVLDLAASGKVSDPLCTQAPEGQTCVPSGGGYSHSYIYCSNHKRLSPGATSCEAKRGRLSRCVGGGVGLTHDYCDDPFCRNGGAYAGNGLYCHNNNIVSCYKDDAPRVRTVCSDVTTTGWNGCRVTEHFQCAGGHPEPFCMLKDKTWDCSR